MNLFSPTRAASGSETRHEIVEVAARLLQVGGPTAVTTRAVAAEAGVQAPTIYRLFGDKEGLLEAVAEHVLAAYLETKTRADIANDPVVDLDHGWATHIGFGLSNPALFSLMANPHRAARLVASAGGDDILEGRIHRVALAGRLRVSERRAVEMIRAAGTGVVLTLLSTATEDRDPELADSVYQAVKNVILTDTAVVPAGETSAAAVVLRANLADVLQLSTAERALMSDWLDRVARG